MQNSDKCQLFLLFFFFKYLRLRRKKTKDTKEKQAMEVLLSPSNKHVEA